MVAVREKERERETQRHTHTHTHREREREREKSVNLNLRTEGASLQFIMAPWPKLKRSSRYAFEASSIIPHIIHIHTYKT